MLHSPYSSYLFCFVYSVLLFSTSTSISRPTCTKTTGFVSFLCVTSTKVLPNLQVTTSQVHSFLKSLRLCWAHYHCHKHWRLRKELSLFLSASCRTIWDILNILQEVIKTNSEPRVRIPSDVHNFNSLLLSVLTSQSPEKYTNNGNLF